MTRRVASVLALPALAGLMLALAAGDPARAGADCTEARLWTLGLGAGASCYAAPRICAARGGCDMVPEIWLRERTGPIGAPGIAVR